MTPPVVPAPPTPFHVRHNRHTVAASTILFRTHLKILRSAQFNPCLGQRTRFATIWSAGTCVPSLYAATAEDAAVFESIFHDIEPTAAFKTVPLDKVVERNVSRIAPRRDIELVPLFAPDLGAWQMVRTDLIDTPKSTYEQTARWAAAVHEAYPSVDGLAWTSKRCDPAVCVLLFGDRLDEADFDVVGQASAGEPDVLARIRHYGKRTGITLVR